MFTGIITEVGKVLEARPGKLVITAKRVTQSLAPGHSIAVNGVCLTVIEFNDRSFMVEVMPETLKRTNLGLLSPGGMVNLENALGLGGHLGGHLVQGHVDATGRVMAITHEGDARLIKVSAPETVMHYVVEKGFITISGISLTVTDCGSDWFQVSIVGYTLTNTTVNSWQAGTVVNLEADIIAKYVARMVTAHGGGITTEFLQDHDFLVT